MARWFTINQSCGGAAPGSRVRESDLAEWNKLAWPTAGWWMMGDVHQSGENVITDRVTSLVVSQLFTAIIQGNAHLEHLWLKLNFFADKMQETNHLPSGGRGLCVLRTFLWPQINVVKVKHTREVFFSFQDWELSGEIGRIFSSFWVMLHLIRKRADLFWFGQAKLALKVKTVAREPAYWPRPEQIHRLFFWLQIGSVVDSLVVSTNWKHLSVKYLCGSLGCMLTL